uniref:von Willebrand factor A domain-containing protein 5A-like n=1 Tax=Hucho hucho TaxID=62062 RepID=A0A4W5LMX6_9TELE
MLRIMQGSMSVPSGRRPRMMDRGLKGALLAEGFVCPGSAPASNPAMDPLLQLISLQKASGSWMQRRMPRMMDRCLKGALLAEDSGDDVLDSDLKFGGNTMGFSDSDIEYAGHFKGFVCPASAPASNPAMDPLLQLISLQKASGSWVLEAALAEVLGKTEEEVAKPKPAPVDQEVWATVLALVWLYGFKMEAQEEWEFLAMKAVSWIQAQKVDSVSECVQAGNILLGCQVQNDTLGL